MTPEGIQLHSNFGRRLLWFMSAWFWLFAADVVFFCALSIYSHHFGTANIVLSSLIPVYRVSFADNRRPLTFYACEDVERFVRRFKAAAEPVS